VRTRILLLTLALAGCGKPAPLEPKVGQSLPPTPYGAEQPPTAASLIDPGPQARPGRTDEILRRSAVRRPDRFDLPPD